MKGYKENDYFYKIPYLSTFTSTPAYISAAIFCLVNRHF